MPMQLDCDPQLSLQTAPSSHWKVQWPPGQELAHVEPFLQSMMQPPPAHDASQVAPARHWMVQLPPEQEGVQVPARHAKVQPPPGQLVAQPPSPQEQPASAEACPPQRGSEAASTVAPSEAPPSRGMHAPWSCPRTASHCASSAVVTAWLQVYCWLCWGHQSQSVESTAHGPGDVSGGGVESEHAPSTRAAASAAVAPPREEKGSTARVL
jgi:hypothetical protein